VLEIYRSV